MYAYESTNLTSNIGFHIMEAITDISKNSYTMKFTITLLIKENIAIDSSIEYWLNYFGKLKIESVGN
jgi:hypothetical protein